MDLNAYLVFAENRNGIVRKKLVYAESIDDAKSRFWRMVPANRYLRITAVCETYFPKTSGQLN